KVCLRYPAQPAWSPAAAIGGVVGQGDRREQPRETVRCGDCARYWKSIEIRAQDVKELLGEQKRGTVIEVRGGDHDQRAAAHHQILEPSAMEHRFVVVAVHVVVCADLRIDGPSPVPGRKVDGLDFAIGVRVKDIGFVTSESGIAGKTEISRGQAPA